MTIILVAAICIAGWLVCGVVAYHVLCESDRIFWRRSDLAKCATPEAFVDKKLNAALSVFGPFAIIMAISDRLRLGK